MNARLAAAGKLDDARPIAPMIEFTFRRARPDQDPRPLSFGTRASTLAGTPVETYLRSRRLELDVAVCGEVLRWHPRLRAMLALFRNIVTNEPQAISRTFLDHEARKIERKFLGPTKGAAIKLDADEDVLGGLHIGEGIETCMTGAGCSASGPRGRLAAPAPSPHFPCSTVSNV